MEIDEMEAGPELDRLVAEEVMGWTVEEHDGKPLHIHKTADKRHWIWLCHWEASADIGIAWEVVEWLSEESVGPSPVTLGGGLNDDDLEWCCEVGPYNSNGDARAEAYAPTAPLAICRAALKARRAAKKLEADTPSNKVLHKTADKYLPTQDSCDEDWEGD